MCVLSQANMEMARKSADQLREQIIKAEEELRALKEQLAQVDEQTLDPGPVPSWKEQEKENGTPAWKWPLSAEEYERYGRQLILPSVGIHGQPSSALNISLLFKI